ncbi:MAG: hypothetical protein H0T46_32390 [Deltaproteobacteria bacterium]|nr:hypothetical protein [Deltaproteobacteria bacterium]
MKKKTATKKGKPAARKKAATKRPAKAKAKAAPKAKSKTKPKSKAAAKPKAPKLSKWPAFIEKHGVVLASAKGAVPSLAEAIAGESIVGSWWSHPKAQVIFDALSDIDDDVDIRCFKLVDGKVTFVHRRLWPALVRLAREGRIPAERAASVQQEHLPTGEHRNIVTPFPDWVPDEVAAAAEQLTADVARKQLGAWA